MKRIVISVIFLISGKLVMAQNSLPPNGNVGVGVLNPTKAIQIADYGAGNENSQLLIPGIYNFEQVRLGQIGNGNSMLEFVNHVSLEGSYGVRLLVDVDHGASGLQFQSAAPSTSYGSLNYSTALYMSPFGNIGINTTSVPAGYKLAVAGDVIAESIKVQLKSSWPDYVFAKDYALPSLAETERHIKEKGHLLGIPSAKEVEANGINLGEMNARLLQKIEELTLHLIDMEKKNMLREAKHAMEMTELRSKIK